MVRSTLPTASDARDLRPTQIYASTPVFLGSEGPFETKFLQVIGTPGYDKRSPRECPESYACQTKRPESNGTKVFQGILPPRISKNFEILEVLRHLLGFLRLCASFRRDVLDVQWCEALSLRPQMLRIFAQRNFMPQPLFSYVLKGLLKRGSREYPGHPGYDKRSPRECPESCECQTKRPAPKGTKVCQGILRPKISKN